MIHIARTHVRRYLGRRLNSRAPVRVYRNLNRPGNTYSVWQDGRVVGHSKFLVVRDVTFEVSEAGRRRALASGVRNVHAWLVGTLDYHDTFFDDDAPWTLGDRTGYLPRVGFWVDRKTNWTDPFGEPEIHRFGLVSSLGACLSKDGLSVSGSVLKGPLLPR